MSDTISVFLVDDDREDREIFKSALAEIDVQVSLSTYNSGKELLDYLYANHKKPDVIFLDLYMPKMDGEECLIEIRKIDALDSTPAVIYSTEYDLDRIERLFSVGANRYLRKPDSFNSLVTSLETTINSVKRNTVGGAALINIIA